MLRNVLNTTLIAAILALAACTPGGDTEATPDRPFTSQVPITLLENTADTPADRAAFDTLVADLKARGWHAHADDGREALYSPEHKH